MDMKYVPESSDKRNQKLEKQFNELTTWIQAHLNEQIGWAELMSQSGLDHQTLQTLFFKYKSTTPMTWIRLQRQTSQQQKSVYKPSFLAWFNALAWHPLPGKATMRLCLKTTHWQTTGWARFCAHKHVVFSRLVLLLIFSSSCTRFSDRKSSNLANSYWLEMHVPETAQAETKKRLLEPLFLSRWNF